MDGLVRFWLAYRSLLEFMMVQGIFALSTFVALYSGVLSLASVTSAAVGGYLAAWLGASFGLNIYAIILAGTIVGALVGLLIAIPLVRLTSHWMALATLSVVLITRVFVLNLEDWTGGAQGKIVTRDVTTQDVGLMLVLLCLFFWRLRGSRLGLAMEAVREDLSVAASLGIPTSHVLRIGFALSGAIGGMGGVLFANLLQYISPDTFYSGLAFIMLASVVFGGAYYWPGPVVGAAAFTALPELLRPFFPRGGEQVANGVMLLIIMIFLPRGLVDFARSQRKPKPGARPEAAPAGRVAEVLPTEPVAPLVRAHAPAGGPDAPGALEISALTKRFGGLAAVDELSLVVPKGAIYGLMGPNGAGKTTVLNLVTGFLAADIGSIVVNGTDVTSWPTHRIARHGVARTYQNIRLFAGLSVVDQVTAGFYAQRSSTLLQTVAGSRSERLERKEYEDRARALLKRVGIERDYQRPADTLPYGDQRRVEVARALATSPSLLLLDEPTAGMNVTESSRMGDLLLQLRDEGLTLLLIEHNIRLVLTYCEHATVMNFGRKVISGTPAECVQDPDVREAYFGRKSDAGRIESLLKLRRD